MDLTQIVIYLPLVIRNAENFNDNNYEISPDVYTCLLNWLQFSSERLHKECDKTETSEGFLEPVSRPHVLVIFVSALTININ